MIIWKYGSKLKVNCNICLAVDNVTKKFFCFYFISKTTNNKVLPKAHSMCAYQVRVRSVCVT